MTREELARHPEHPFAQLFELQVGLDLVLVEVVFRLAHLLRVIAVVPGLDLDAGAGDGLHVRDLFTDARHRRLPHRLHELHGALGRPGHRVLEAPVGVGLVAEPLGPLRAQLQDLGDERVVVVRVTVVAAAVIRLPHLLAQQLLHACSTRTPCRK